MLKAVSVTSLQSLGSMHSAVSVKNRPPEYRRNLNGTVIFLQVILFTILFVAREAYDLFAGNKVQEKEEKVLFGLRVLRAVLSASMVGNLGLALGIRGFGLQKPFLKYLTLPLAALALLPPAFLQKPLDALNIILTFLAFLEVSIIYAGLLTQNRKTALGRNVQPWYEKTPLFVTNIEIGRSVSMLRATQSIKR